MPLTLVIGGTRSGKSEHAERAVAESGLPVTYVATGTASDEEMAARITCHRERRPDSWRTVETTDPLGALADAQGQAVLVDSLGGWIAAGLDRDREDLLGEVRTFAGLAAERPQPTVVVAEETGLAPVPVNALARRFTDVAGEAAQLLSAAARRSFLVVAGRSVELGPPASAIDPDLRLHGDALARDAADDFAVNVVDAPRPSWLEDALAAGVRASASYPDERDAREAIASRHDRPPEEVVLTNGANEAFWLIAGAVRPRHAVCVHPSYTEPEAALRAHGVHIERAYREPAGLTLDPRAVPAGADLVVTGNPNNPSGTLDPAERIASLAAPGRALVVDEAFMDFVAGESESLAGRRDLPGLVVVRSLTKLWSLPGIRAGYVLAPARIARALERIRPSWSVNSVALSALRVCATRVSAAEERARQVAAARGGLASGLARISGLATWPSAANFILARTREQPELAERLRAQGIAVRPCASFPGLGPDHFRMAVRDEDANQRLLAAVGEAVG